LKHKTIIMRSIYASMSDRTRYLLPTDAVRDATDPRFVERGAMAIQVQILLQGYGRFAIHTANFDPR
jgi:hypothetical protein